MGEIKAVIGKYFFTTHTMSIAKNAPAWFQSGDLIEKRGNRTFLVSMTQTIPRWKYWLNRLKF